MLEKNKIAGYTITLPGKTLYLTPLLSQKKFRAYGNKDGAVKAFFQLENEAFFQLENEAFFQLENEGLGKTAVIGNSRSNPVSNIYALVETQKLNLFT